MSPLPYDDLKKTSKEEIVREIDSHLAQLNSSIAEFRKAHHALQAQLLIQELASREQRRQTNVMVACTVIITALTVAITFLTAVTTWVTMFPNFSRTGAGAAISAPACQNGSQTCEPWERDWSKTQLQPGSQ